MTAHRFGVALAALLLGGCGLGRSHVPQDVRVLAQQGVAIEVAWRVQVKDSEYFGPGAYERGGVAVSEDGTRVVATTSRGEVLCVGATSGEVLWRVQTVAEPFAAPPAVADGVVYVAAPDGIVRALHLASGGEVWARALGDVFHSAPVAAGDRVVVNTATGRVHGLNRLTGQVMWQADRQSSSALTVAGGGGASVVGDTTYVGFPDGSLAALDRRGSVVWLADLAAGEERLRDVDTTPLVVDGSVYAASFSGGLARVDTRRGETIWRTDLRGATSPIAVGNRLVTATAEGEVVWLDPSSGEVLARLELDGDAASALVRWGADYLVLSEPSDGLYILASARPWIHARFNPDTGFSGAAAVHGSRVWALSDGGYLYGLRIVSAGTGG